MLMFRGVSVRYRAINALTVQPVGDCMYAVRLSPGDVPVFEAPTREGAETFVSECNRLLKRGLSEGATGIDFTSLPVHAETGTVMRRGA